MSENFTTLAVTMLSDLTTRATLSYSPLTMLCFCLGLFVFFSVCWFVSRIFSWKIMWIFVTFLERERLGLSNNWLYFGGNLKPGEARCDEIAKLVCINGRPYFSSRAACSVLGFDNTLEQEWWASQQWDQCRKYKRLIMIQNDQPWRRFTYFCALWCILLKASHVGTDTKFTVQCFGISYTVRYFAFVADRWLLMQTKWPGT